MSAEVDHVHASDKAQLPGALPRIGYFLLHLLEMCIVMCAAGIGILSALLRWGGPLIGYPEPKTRFPEISTLVLAIWLAVVMIVWMRLRGHEWQATLEMASTSIIAFPLLIGASLFGIISASDLFALECGLACAFMLVPMLLRLDHYAGPHTGHVHDAYAGRSHHAQAPHQHEIH